MMASLFDSEDVGNDSQGETTDNCATAATPDCTKIKNAIQADVVATGPPDSRYITKAYVGDLDGNVWRFDFAMVSGLPNITARPISTPRAARIRCSRRWRR